MLPLLVKSLPQIVSPPAVVTPPPVAKPVPQPALPPGPTQKEKDALVASLTAQKDTFPSMNPHSLSLPSLVSFLFNSTTTCSLTPSSSSSFSFFYCTFPSPQSTS